MLDQFYDNQNAKQTLVHFLNDGRLPHAILLEGPDGCGKTTFAKLIAAAVLCTGEEKPCGVCASCKKVTAGQHPDLILSQNDDRANGFHIDEIRKIKNDAYIYPNDGEYKVYILRNAHNMTEQAQNAMLKIIEEPPKHVVFILTCNNRSKLLPTILSRVTAIALSVPTVEECAGALVQLVPQREEQEYRKAAEIADGNIGKAMILLQDSEKMDVLSKSGQWMEMICFGREYDMMASASAFERRREDLILVLEGMKEIAAKILRLKNGVSSTDTQVQELSDRLTGRQVAGIAAKLDETLQYARQNGNMALLTTQLCYSLRQVVEGRK